MDSVSTFISSCFLLCGRDGVLIWLLMNGFGFAIADMRKAMPRDVHKQSIIPLKKAITPEELEYD